MSIKVWSTDETSPGARGRAFGEAFTSSLAAALEEYLTLFDVGGLDPVACRGVVDRCLETTAVHAPDVAAEVEGIAHGAGLEPWQVMTLNARTEVLALMRPAGSECSTAVLLPADGSPPRTIQTWDWLDALRADTVVRRYPGGDGRRVATFTETGQVAKIGVNDRGLGVHFNILHHAGDGSGSGVPVHVLARRILDVAATLDEAITLAHELPVSASTALTIVAYENGSPRAASIEVTPAGIAVLPATPGRLLAHTNHLLDPGLAAGEVSVYASTTVERLACLADHASLVEVPDPLERALALGALPDAPISMFPRPEAPRHLQWASKATIVLDVAAPALEFHEGGPATVTREGWRRVTV